MWFHDLRKTALTAFAAAGATNGEVMHIAGHTSLDVASIYQQSLDSHLDDVYRRLESGGAEKPSADGGDAATAAALAALPVAPRMAALNALDGCILSTRCVPSYRGEVDRVTGRYVAGLSWLGLSGRWFLGYCMRAWVLR